MRSDLESLTFEFRDNYFHQIQFYKLGRKKCLVMMLHVAINMCVDSR